MVQVLLPPNFLCSNPFFPLTEIQSRVKLPKTDTATDTAIETVTGKAEINVVVGIVRVDHCPVGVKLELGPRVESGQLPTLLVSIRTLITRFPDRGPNPGSEETQITVCLGILVTIATEVIMIRLLQTRYQVPLVTLQCLPGVTDDDLTNLREVSDLKTMIHGRIQIEVRIEMIEDAILVIYKPLGP